MTSVTTSFAPGQAVTSCTGEPLRLATVVIQSPWSVPSQGGTHGHGATTRRSSGDRRAAFPQRRKGQEYCRLAGPLGPVGVQVGGPRGGRRSGLGQRSF